MAAAVGSSFPLKAWDLELYLYLNAFSQLSHVQVR